MRILQLCKKFPYPLKDGESIAVNSLSKAYHALECKVTLLSMNTVKHYFDLSQLPTTFDHYKEIHAIDLDNRIKPKDAFVNLFSQKSYHISRFISPEFEQKLIFLLKKEKFDAVQLESVYMAPYIPIIKKYSNAIIAMRAHNIEYEIWDRIASTSSFFLQKWYLQHLVVKLKNYELAQLQHYDVLLPITSRDLEVYRKLGFHKKAIATPVGIDTSLYPANYTTYERPISLSFIGSLDWMPNQEGIRWFLDNVWPKLHQQHPNTTLHIAGRNTPDWLYKMQVPGVVIAGEVADATTFMNQHSIMIVPLFSGSGIRVKILEGMALGRTVITTNIGMEGIKAKHQQELLIANTAKDFMEQINYCYHNYDKLIHIGQRARNFIHQNYGNISIAKDVLYSYHQLLKPKQQKVLRVIHKSLR